MEEQKKTYEEKLSNMEQEMSDLLNQRNAEMDKNLKIEETIDAKNERILQLEKDLQRKTDEVNLRKEVIESMSASLMKHERESGEMA